MNSKSIVNDNMNTPETDAVLTEVKKHQIAFFTQECNFGGGIVTWENPIVTLCRRFERERDEAREWKQIAEIRKDTIIQYQNRAVAAEEELDNIREQYRIAVDMAALAQNKLFIAKAELERLKK